MNKKQQPLISITVPVYNGEKFLYKLYESISNQTYSNFEVLCVDDFSSDDSYEILREFEKKDKRFIALKQKEKGGTAVKGQVFTLPYCKGEYYFFLSQDDFIDNDLFEKCIRKAIETDADVVIPNMVMYHEQIKNEKNGKYPIAENYNQVIEPREAFLLSLSWELHGFSLVKMDLVKRVGIQALYYNSDEYCVRKQYLCANKITFANTNVYYRQDNLNAITKTKHYFDIDTLMVEVMLYELICEYNFEEKIQKSFLRKLKKSYFSWIKEYYFTTQFDKDGRIYGRNMLRKIKKRLWK